MSRVIAVDKGDRRELPFTIKASGVVANLAAYTVTCYKKTSKQSWSLAVSINTVDDADQIVIVSAAAGTLKLTPLASWWSETGEFDLKFIVGSTPPYFAPSANSHRFRVVDAP